MPKHAPEQIKQQARELFSLGLGIRQVGRLLQRDHTTISLWLGRKGRLVSYMKLWRLKNRLLSTKEGRVRDKIRSIAKEEHLATGESLESLYIKWGVPYVKRNKH